MIELPCTWCGKSAEAHTLKARFFRKGEEAEPKTCGAYHPVDNVITKHNGTEFLVPVHEHFACCQTCAALVPAGYGSMKQHGLWHLRTKPNQTIG